MRSLVHIAIYAKAYESNKKHITTPNLLLSYVVKCLTISIFAVSVKQFKLTGKITKWLPNIYQQAT